MGDGAAVLGGRLASALETLPGKRGSALCGEAHNALFRTGMVLAGRGIHAFPGEKAGAGGVW